MLNFIYITVYCMPSSLNERLLEEYAGMCVETVQRVASLVTETMDSEESIGLLPWWNGRSWLISGSRTSTTKGV